MIVDNFSSCKILNQYKNYVYFTGQKKKNKKTASGSSTSSSSRSDTPTKSIETADKTIADAAKKLKDISSPGKRNLYDF